MTHNWYTNPYILLPILNVLALLWFVLSRIEWPKKTSPTAHAGAEPAADGAAAAQASSAAAARDGLDETETAHAPAETGPELDFDSIDSGEILPLESVFSRLQERVEKQTRRKAPTGRPVRTGMQLEQVL